MNAMHTRFAIQRHRYQTNRPSVIHWEHIAVINLPQMDLHTFYALNEKPRNQSGRNMKSCKNMQNTSKVIQHRPTLDAEKPPPSQLTKHFWHFCLYTCMCVRVYMCVCKKLLLIKAVIFFWLTRLISACFAVKSQKAAFKLKKWRGNINNK